MDIAEHELQALYTWVDGIPLSRPKRNIARDFSDGVLMAETMSHFFPRLVELHNYSPANGLQQKMYNWNTLHQKVFKRLGISVTKDDLEDICNCKARAIERLLKFVKLRVEEDQQSDVPESARYSTWSGTPTSSANNAQPQGTQPATRVPASTKPQSPAASAQARQHHSDAQEKAFRDLQETNEILEMKVRKLEQLVKLKDAKIQTLMAKLQAAGML